MPSEVRLSTFALRLLVALLALQLHNNLRPGCLAADKPPPAPPATPTTPPQPPVEEVEPPFPDLFLWNKRKMRIVSEVVEADSATGSQTQEEYLDLGLGKAAFVLTNKAGYRAQFVDAQEGLVFTYRPYKCKVQRVIEVSDNLLVEDELSADKRLVWNYNTPTTLAPELGENPTEAERAAYTRSSPRDFRLFGVAGLWLAANDKPKSFARAQLIYSAAKNVYRESLMWLYHDERLNLDIKFYFIDHRPFEAAKKNSANLEVGEGEQPTLEMVKIEAPGKSASDEPKLLRTINILSVERSLGPEVYANLLSVPLGFGCFSSISDAWALSPESGELADEIRERRAFANVHGESLSDEQWQGHAELEVTATRYEPAAQSKRSSDTFSVELAHSHIRGYGLERHPLGSRAARVKLIRWRNTLEDQKVMMHHLFRVKYSIDMRRGTCEMSHLEGVAGASASDQAAAQVVFRNGLKFDANVDLFRDSDDLHYIKTTGSREKRGLELHFYEGTAGSEELAEWLGQRDTPIDHKRTRVIRAYEAHEYDHLAGAPPELKSLTIWVLDENEAHILESYQVHVVSMRTFEPAGQFLERAKLFDVSRECFLENERRLQNRDFAWVTRTYPAPTRLLQVLAENQLELKRIYYQKFMVDFTRAPRVEILLGEDSLRIRSLLLDLPGVEFIYDKSPGTLLELDYSREGDADFMAPDLQHCAHLCQLNRCTLMSYCPSAHNCFVSSRPVHVPAASPSGTSNASAPMPARLALKTVKACDTYQIPELFERTQLHRAGRLATVLASLQHQEYGTPPGMPPVPDEASLPVSESGLSELERHEAVGAYMEKLDAWLRANNRLPSSAIALEIGGHFSLLVPSKFELERDPLAEFSLHESTSGGTAHELAELDGAAGTPIFHKGLSMSRFNPTRVAGQQLEGQLEFRTLRGLNYDQCALACLDSKCGTFSHCSALGECVLSSLNSTARAQLLGVVDQDPDCFVAQRDFLGNFVKFENVFRPQVYRLSEQQVVADPSECALKCVAQADFRCLSFEFCRPPPGKAGGRGSPAPSPAAECFYQTERHLLDAGAVPLEPNPSKRTGCDHYARSALADFLRLDSRRVAPQVLEQLKTSTFEGLSVFECAERCASELADCGGFQFCLVPPERGVAGGAPPEVSAGIPRLARQCVTLESKVTADMLAGLGANGTSSSASHEDADEETIVDEQADGAIVHAGRYLKFDAKCQVFSMREDTAEAHLRDLALGGLVRTSSEKAAQEARERARNSSGLSLLGGLFLYLAVVALSAGLACALVLGWDNRELLRQRASRLRIVMGL